MTYLAILSLMIAMLSLIVAMRTAKLNYTLRANEIRRDIGAQISADLGRADRAKLLLEYVNVVNPIAKENTQLDLPSLSEMEAFLKAFSSNHASRPDHEVIGMRNTDYDSLRAIQEPLSKIEHRLDALKILAVHVHNDKNGTA